ncbi:MAG: thiamine pyrophosphate-binding protein, partial [Mycobacterium sp.]
MSTGADVVIGRLLAGGVDVCFANPGTSEMHFVAALDHTPSMRAVLCLFEGVATGAADGYARIAGTAAATLLHLGPGLANGLANLHNARRAHSPVLNIVGDHATHHTEFDAPLESDIEALARWPEGLVFRPATADALAVTVDEAVAAAAGPPGRVATVILPADYSWSTADIPVVAPPEAPVGDDVSADIEPVAEVLRTYGPNTVLFLGGAATTEAGRIAAERISSAMGARA